MSKILVYRGPGYEASCPYTVPEGFEDVSFNISANGLRFAHMETGATAVVWVPEQEALSGRLQAAIDGSCRATLARHNRKAAPETLQDLDRETYGFESLKTSTTQAAAKIAMGLGIQVDQKPVDLPKGTWPANSPEGQKIIAADWSRKVAKACQAINPKEIAGSKKPSVWSVMPRWIVLQVGRVMSVGAAKYGAFNYRESPIAASTYQDALERHLGLWFDGEDNDHETGVSHLASAIASCTLLMDAQATGKLVDDRQKTGLFRKHLDALEALLVTLPLPLKKAA